MGCLFCQREFDLAQNRERTREHVFADWMTPYLRSSLGPGTQARWEASRDGESQHSYSALPAQQVVQGVCRDCNNGWLSDIQVAAKPHLLPALQSTRSRRFGESAQEAMSVWAYRAMLVAGVKGEIQIPISYLHGFYKSRELPGSTRIWAFATPEREFTALQLRSIRVSRAEDESPARANAYAGIVAVGHIGFLLLRWTEVKPSSSFRSLYRDFGDCLAPVFPVRGAVVWPPSNALTQKGLDQVIGVLGSWEGE